MKRKTTALFLFLNLLLSPVFSEGNRFIQNSYQSFPETSQLVNRAFDLASQGDFEIAIERLKEAWSLNPKQTEAFIKSLSIVHNNYGKALIQRKQAEAAAENFRKALFYDQQNLTASKNLDLLLKEQEVNPSHFQERLRFARSLRTQKKLEESIAEYQEALKSENLGTEKKQILMELGQVYYVYSLTLFEGAFFKRQVENLAKILTKLRELRTRDPRFYLLEGFYFRQRKDLASSLDSFQDAVDLDRSNKQAGSELVRTWKKIIELNPEEEQNWKGLRSAMLKVYRNKDQSKYFTAAGYKLLSFAELEKSLDFFEDALLINSADQDALDGLIKAWKEIVKKAPDYPNNWIGFSQSLAKKGLYKESKLASQKAKELAEENTISHRLSPELQSEVNRLLEQDKSLELAKEAYQEQEKGNCQKAIGLYQEALAKMVPSPESAKIFYNLFLCYQKEKETLKAWESLQKAYQYDPSSKEIQIAYQNLQEYIFSILLKAKSELDQKNYYQADQLYKKALQFKRDDPEIYFNLGFISQELKRYKLAKDYYQKALELSPNNSDYFKALNSLQKHLDRSSNDDFSVASGSEEINFETLVKEGLKYQSKNKDLSLAIKKYQQALEINPESPVVNFNLGTVFHKLNQKQKAIDFYKKAYRYDQLNYPETNFFIGFLLESLGKFKLSTAHYALYLQDQPNGTYAKEALKRTDFIEKLLN